MSSKRTVLFVNDSAYLLEGYRHTAKHIRGRVVNGGWTMYIVKADKLRWVMFSAENRDQCVEANKITKFNPILADFVEVPENVLGDYNVIINWARARKEEANAKSVKHPLH